MAVAVQMTRIASALGVAPAAAAEMVRTNPGAVEGLTPDDPMSRNIEPAYYNIFGSGLANLMAGGLRFVHSGHEMSNPT